MTYLIEFPGGTRHVESGTPEEIRMFASIQIVTGIEWQFALARLHSGNSIKHPCLKITVEKSQ